MVDVVFRFRDGGTRRLDIPDGQSVMEGAVRQGVDGIEADGGGALSCATCHVWVDPHWSGKLPARNRQEDEMLEFAIGVNERSRLSCQIIVDASLAGLTVDVPPTQK